MENRLVGVNNREGADDVASKFYGKYRAEVTNVYDDKIIDNRGKENRGRIRVKCPKVLGEYESNWCEPCFSYCFDDYGDFFLPEKGDTVWVEFEEGNPNKPIWVGNWFQNDRTPINNDKSRDETPDPLSAQPLKDYEEHHDKTRFIQFGRFWIIMHRNPDYMRVYLDDDGGTNTEFFTDLNEVRLKRWKGTMEFFSNDEETYLKRESGDMELYTNDDKTYLHRKDSELIMVDDDTKLFKGANTLTMTTEDTTLETPSVVTVNAGALIQMTAPLITLN